MKSLIDHQSYVLQATIGIYIIHVIRCLLDMRSLQEGLAFVLYCRTGYAVKI